MSLERKVRSVEGLFKKADRRVAAFCLKSGLSCLPNCCQCCFNTNIGATILEFLPLAYHLFKTDQAGVYLESLRCDHSIQTCIFLRVNQPEEDIKRGRCLFYAKRGLLCRLFGFAAVLDKYGKARLASCRVIKESQRDLFQMAESDRNKLDYAPAIKYYYGKLGSVDFYASQHLYHINTAIRYALEMVLQYYTYRRRVRF